MLCQRASPHRDRREVFEESWRLSGEHQQQLLICAKVNTFALYWRARSLLMIRTKAVLILVLL